MSASNQHKYREFAAAPPTPASACPPASVQSIIHFTSASLFLSP
ncbi:unnamed protein product [Ectocarpus sp. 8 AP-2014]